jgi:hypothetical protein
MMSKAFDPLSSLADTPQDTPSFELDPHDVLRRARSHRMRRRIIAAASGLSVAGVAAMTAFLLLTSSQPPKLFPSTAQAGIAQSRLAVSSCEETGQPTTLAQAAGASPFTLLVPHDPLADAGSTASLVGLWQCSGSEIETRFSSGITVWEDTNDIPDPAASWKALADQDPVETSVGSVQGQPAALIDPAKSPGGANGSVTFVLSGTWVVVEGNGHISIADLIRVAESMRAV